MQTVKDKSDDYKIKSSRLRFTLLNVYHCRYEVDIMMLSLYVICIMEIRLTDKYLDRHNTSFKWSHLTNFANLMGWKSVRSELTG